MDKEYSKISALIRSGDITKAESVCDALLANHHDDYRALYLKGTICLLQKKYEESRSICQKLISFNSTDVDVCQIMAAISESYDNDINKTEFWLKQGLDSDPLNHTVLLNLGNLNLKKGDIVCAENYFNRSLQLNPENTDAISGLSVVQTQRGNLEEAVLGYKKALELDPTSSQVLYNLIILLFKMNLRDEALKYSLYVATLKEPGIAAPVAATIAAFNCMFDAHQKLLPHMLKIFQEGKVDPWVYSFASLPLLSVYSLSNEQLFLFHLHAAEVIRRNLRDQPYTSYPLAFSNLRKLRVGYLSSDFYNHVLGNFFRWLVAHSDASKFEIFMYSNLSEQKEDVVTDEYKKEVRNFINVSEMTDVELAKRIHDDGIHILVEMNGHTGTDTLNRLAVLALRPAPIQIAYLNYPYSYGLKEVDYVISDPWLNGGANCRYFSEEPIELPQTFLTIGKYFARPPFDVDAALIKAKAHFTFGSLNNIYKLNPKAISVWSEILRRTPGSILFINHPALSSVYARASISEEFNRYGITDDRLFLEWHKHPDGSHLNFYNRIDVALDAFPLTGGTTTVDALWMGVPVITLVGEAHAQRLSYSIMKNSGLELDDCIAFTETEYIDKAVLMASNENRRIILRKTLPESMSKSNLGNSEKFSKDFESLLITAWNKKNYFSKIGEVMSNAIVMPLNGLNCGIAVSGDVNDIYAYVIDEQGAWFEDEWQFLSRNAMHFTKFLDFSEDPGIYAVSIATLQKSCGGSSVAVRKLSNYADLVHKSSEFNGLSNLSVVLDANGESPDLVRFSLDYNDGEGVLLAKHLDEVDSSSPLILVSLYNREGRDLSALPTLAEKGYQSYKLLPGFDLLVPHKFGEKLFNSDINLFFCKQDRAEQLATIGLLCLQEEPLILHDYDSPPWLEYIQNLNYAKSKKESWKQAQAFGKGGEAYINALNLFAEALHCDLPAPQRYARIKVIEMILTLLMQSEATPSRLLTGVRFMREIGHREQAIHWLDVLLQGIDGMSGELLDEPFYAPERLWEDNEILQEDISWLYPISLISLERLSRFSSWFTGDAGLKIWEQCAKYPCVAKEAYRMIALINRRKSIETQAPTETF